MLKKRGLSAIIATLIIILLTLVAVGIIWVVINNIVERGAEQIELGQFTLDLQIKAAQVQDGDVTVVVVRRNPGQGNFVGMNFIFSDGQNSEIIRENTTLKEGDQKSFTFRLKQISTANLKTVSVAPIFEMASGKESAGNIADTFDVPANKSIGAAPGNFVALGYRGAETKEYTFSSQSGDIIKFSKAVVDPLDVLPGDNQTFTAVVYSSNGIVGVTSVTELDNSILNLDFEKISDDGAGTSTWSASWIVNDTHTIEYRTKITATDSQGNSGSVTLTWTDSCQSQLAPHGVDRTLSDPCTTGVNGVDGIDAGSLTIAAGVTLTIDSGSTFIFNQGKSITITATGAKIASTSTGSFGNGYLFYTDGDSDNRSVNSTLTYSTTSTFLSGKVRAKDALTTTDCNDGSASVWFNGYGVDSDGDGYGVSSLGCNNGAANGVDCCDSDANAKPGQTSYFTTTRTTCGGYDYDCNSAEDKQYPAASVCDIT